MKFLEGKFVGIKGFVKKAALLWGYEIRKHQDGTNSLHKIYSRKPSVQFAKEHLKQKEIIAAEVGVWKGHNTEHIIKVLPIKKIYAIDPWIPFSSSEHDAKTMSIAEQATRKRLSRYGNKVEIIKSTADKAVKLLPEKMDFIYIDGNHDYEYVKNDIENYYKKLRVGGILAGDDIQNRRIPNGVAKALAEFTVKKKIDFFIEAPDWWLIKK